MAILSSFSSFNLHNSLQNSTQPSISIIHPSNIPRVSSNDPQFINPPSSRAPEITSKIHLHRISSLPGVWIINPPPPGFVWRWQRHPETPLPQAFHQGGGGRNHHHQHLEVHPVTNDNHHHLEVHPHHPTIFTRRRYWYLHRFSPSSFIIIEEEVIVFIANFTLKNVTIGSTHWPCLGYGGGDLSKVAGAPLLHALLPHCKGSVHHQPLRI